MLITSVDPIWDMVKVGTSLPAMLLFVGGNE